MTKKFVLELEVAVLIFILISLAHILISATDQKNISGYAVVDNPNQVQTTVQEIMRESILEDIQKEAKICIMVKNANDTYTYALRKRGEIFNVMPSSGTCDGPTQEDFIITINGYYRLLAFKQKNNVGFFTEKPNERIEFLESKYILPNGRPTCDPEFKTKYCVFINKQFTKNERTKLGLQCCDDPDVEMPVKDSSTTFIARWWWLIMLIGISAAIGVGGIFFLSSKEERIELQTEETKQTEELEDLIEYIRNTRGQGFGDMIIKKALEEQGWPENMIDKGFETIKNEHLSSFDRFEKVF